MTEYKLAYFELYNGHKVGSLPHSLYTVEIINTFITPFFMCNVFINLAIRDRFEDFAHIVAIDYGNTITNEKETYDSIKQHNQLIWLKGNVILCGRNVLAITNSGHSE